MTQYRITNKISGQDLGVFDGEDPADAARAMRLDAGYANDTMAATVLGVRVVDLDDELEIEEV